jgi:hypothetical protein
MKIEILHEKLAKTEDLQKTPLGIKHLILGNKRRINSLLRNTDATVAQI